MDLKESVREYLGLKTDAFKLGLIENLTMVINQLLVTIVLILTLMTALIFMAAGVNKWLGLVLDKDGIKMSKHKGNVVNPWSVLDKQGADAVRWYFYTASAPWLPSRFSVS